MTRSGVPAWRRRLVQLVLGACLLPITLAASAQGAAQPPLREVELTAGIHLIRAEVADSFPTRQAGLMFRQKMAASHGMLFVFGTPAGQCMWMKNTLLPLSVAFIDEQGVIVNIEDMSPQTENSHCSARPVTHALEMNQGWFAGKGIAPGTRITGLDKAGRPR
jgi:uncharacterized membrane protein (UPF0127 family)